MNGALVAPRLHIAGGNVPHSTPRPAPVAALLALAAGGACDPSPTFPAPAQPLVGRVVFERELTMGTEPIDLKTYPATLHVDPGTVPLGTRLLVRILDGVVKDPTGDTGGAVWTFDGRPNGAVQLLTDVTTFERPILLTAQGFSPSTALPDVLHADESAATWTRVGKVTTPPPSDYQVGAALTGPHLWSIAIPPPATLAPPSGLYDLDRLFCGANDLTATPKETLEIDGGRYVWTRAPAGGGCDVVERGVVALDVQLAYANFVPDGGDSYTFELQIVASNAFALKANVPVARECPANTTTYLSFVRPIDAADASAPARGSDGGCAADAGGSDERGSDDAQGG